jgi:multiple sugar transport system substrate-binding protein
LNDRLQATSWWPNYVESVKSEGAIDGQVYAPSNGVNTNALIFDKTVFAKAGLPADWKPKTWNDVLDAARAIKKSDPNVWPLWVLGGTAAGTSGAVLGPANFISGSVDPVIHDTKNDTWVVDSKGIREALGFYKTASSEGLLAPASQLLNSNGPGIVGGFFPKHQIGIALGGNYVPLIWDKDICSPCWPEGATQTGVAPFPTSGGQAPGIATTMSGWNLAIAKSTKNPDMAFKLLDSMLQKQRLLEVVNYGGFVPPIAAYNTEEYYVDLWPATQTFFANLVPVGQTPPSVSEYKVWAYALGQATETLILKPETSLDDVMASMKEYIEGQIGADKIEIHQ